MCAVPFACSAEKECADACEEAQEGNCTSIKGDCGNFCTALFNVEDPSGCSSQIENYQDCLNEGSDVCDVSCGATETALSTCVGSYCLSRTTEPDCATLIDSF